MLTYTKLFKPSKLVILRYLLYGIVALEVYVLPIILSQKLHYFADIERIRGLLLFTTSLSFGYHSGFLKLIKDKFEINNSNFILGNLIISIPASIYTYFITQSPFFAIAICFLFINVSFEKIFQCESRYFLMLFVKPLQSAIFILLVFFVFRIFDVDLKVEVVFGASIVFNSLIFFPLINDKYQLRFKGIFMQSWLLIKSGWSVNLTTILFSFFLFNFRESLFGLSISAITSFALVLGVSQVIGAYFSVKNLEFEVKLIHDDSLVDFGYIKSLMIKLLWQLVISIPIVLLGYWVLTRIYSNYEWELFNYILIAVGWLIFCISAPLITLCYYLNMFKFNLLFWGIVILTQFIVTNSFQLFPTGYFIFFFIVFVIHTIYLFFLLISKNNRGKQ